MTESWFKSRITWLQSLCAKISYSCFSCFCSFCLLHSSLSLLERLLNILVCLYPAKTGEVLTTLVNITWKEEHCTPGVCNSSWGKSSPGKGETQGTVLGQLCRASTPCLESLPGELNSESPEFCFIREIICHYAHLLIRTCPSFTQNLLWFCKVSSS